MNNAFMIKEDVLQEDIPKDNSPELRERAEVLTDIIEALQNIAGSSYWKVLQKHVFNVDLVKAKSRLAKTNDTIEIFRLQGEIGWGDKVNLDKQVTKYRNELETIRKKIK